MIIFIGKPKTFDFYGYENNNKMSQNMTTMRSKSEKYCSQNNNKSAVKWQHTETKVHQNGKKMTR